MPGPPGVLLPSPGWVIKVLRLNGEKVFINLCHHQEVPAVPVTLGYLIQL